MKLVAIDTSGPVIGVAACVGERVAFRQARAARGAEVLLTPWLRAVADEVGLPLMALDGVIVAVGPGAFTGLRVGLAAGLGLAVASGCLVAPVGSLASRAARARWPRVASVLDARKGRVYASLYEGGSLVRGPEDVPPEQVAGWAGDAPLWLTGEGAPLVPVAHNLCVADGFDDPALLALLALGREQLELGKGQDPSTVTPCYVRPPDAVPRVS